MPVSFLTKPFLGHAAHQQWEVIVSVAFVYVVGALYTFTAGYSYYGHDRNALPHGNVFLLWLSVATFVWAATVFVSVVSWSNTVAIFWDRPSFLRWLLWLQF
jgi:hypothetical protein